MSEGRAKEAIDTGPVELDLANSWTGTENEVEMQERIMDLI